MVDWTSILANHNLTNNFFWQHEGQYLEFKSLVQHKNVPLKPLWSNASESTIQIYMLISSFAFKQNSVTKNLERFWIYSGEENSLIFWGVKTPQETSYRFLDFA